MKGSQAYAVMAVVFALLALGDGSDFIIYVDRLLASLSLVGMAVAGMSERRKP